MVEGKSGYAPDAARALAYFGIAIVLVAALAAATIHTLQRATETGRGLAILGVFPANPDVWTGLALALVILVGGLLSRAFWISYYAFKQKTYDPLALPHHVMMAVQSPFLGLAVFGFGAWLGLPLVELSWFNLSLALAFGYFAEETWEVFQRVFRGIVGKEPPKAHTLPFVDGVDLPIDLVADVGDVVLQDAKGVVRRLHAAGVTHAHHVVALRKAGRLGELARRVQATEADLEALAAAGERVSDPAALAKALEKNRNALAKHA